MNMFTQGYLLSGLVSSFAVGLATSLVSALIHGRSHKKISLFFLFIRFLKGFFSVALIYLYIYFSMRWSPLNNLNSKTVSSSLVSSIISCVELAIPILIVVVVHKVTKRIEISRSGNN